MSIWRPWADYGHSLAKLEVLGLQLAVSWVVLGGPWAGLGVILEPVGIILGCIGPRKLVQSAPAYDLADIGKTMNWISILITHWMHLFPDPEPANGADADHENMCEASFCHS